jgi:NAD-dependent dihydropyrimidine dehydrogenase PreA subunit
MPCMIYHTSKVSLFWIGKVCLPFMTFYCKFFFNCLSMRLSFGAVLVYLISSITIFSGIKTKRRRKGHFVFCSSQTSGQSRKTFTKENVQIAIVSRSKCEQTRAKRIVLFCPFYCIAREHWSGHEFICNYSDWFFFSKTWRHCTLSSMSFLS